MQKKFHSLILGVSVLPALLVMPAMAVNVDNWDDFVNSAKSDVEEGQTRITTLDADLSVPITLAPKDGIINGNGHTLSSYSFYGTPELVGQMGVYEWQYTNENGDAVKFYTSSSSLSATSHTEIFSDMELQNSLGTVDYKSGSSFDLTGRGTTTNYIVAADDENFVNGVYKVQPTSATAKKTYYVVCLEDQATGNKVYVSKNLTITEQGYTAADVLANTATSTYYEDYFGEGKHFIKVKNFEAGQEDGTYDITVPDLMTLDNSGNALQKPHKEYVVDGQHIYISPTGDINTITSVSTTPDLGTSNKLYVDRTDDTPLFYTRDNYLFVGSNGMDVTINDITLSDFIYKSSSNYGAAVTLSWGGNLTMNNSVIKDNVNNDSYLGGAIGIIGGNLTLNNVSVKNNTATGAGAALTVGNRIVSTGSIGNKVYNYVIGNAVIHGGEISDNSTADSGGAIYVTLKNESSAASYGIEALDNELTLDGTLLRRNHSVDVAGAIGNFGKMTIQNGTRFLNNSTDGDGGVMFLGAESTTMITRSQFGAGSDSGNTAGAKGGVIRTRDASEANNIGAKLDILNGSQFIGNSAGTDGGVLYNNFYSSVTNDDAVTIAGSTFALNSANNGGVIYNSGIRDNNGAGSFGKISIGNSVFSGNTATTNGGAIYNEGIITLAGANQFTGNTAAGKANDIYNVGALNIASGTTVLDGGIDGDGILTIANGATLNIGKATITQGTINLGGTLVAELVDSASPIFNATEFNNIEDNGKLSLLIKKEGTYNLFSDAKFDKTQEQVVSTVYDLDWTTNEGRSVIATMKKAEDIAEETGVANDVAAAVAHITQSAAQVESKPLQELSLKIQEKLATGDTGSVEHATKAIHPETESVAQSVSTSVQNTVVNLASARMATPSVGRNGGDVKFTKGGVWVQGLFNKSKQGDLFNGYTRGIAAGLDGTINKRWTIGAGYSYAHSDITGTARDTKINSNTVFLYGQYKPSELYINAIANYTISDYSENGTVIEGSAITADYKSKSFGGAVNAGYDFASGITPELGLRYMHVSTDDYANSYGIKTHMDNTNFLTGVFGAKYAFNVAAGRHMKVMPQLNAGVKYDLASDKNLATITMPGVDSYTLEGNRLSRLGGEFGIGLGMNYHNLDLSVNYDIDVRDNYTSQTGMLKFRCNF